MKNLLLVPAIALLSLTFTAKSNALDIAQSVCEYVSVDDKARLRSFLKTNKLKIRAIFDGVQCNGKNLVAFAGSRNAIETGSLMIGKLPKDKIQDILASLEGELSTVAEKRING